MKKILLTLLALVVAFILGIVIFLLTFDLNHYRHFVETQASHALGRPVEIKSLATKLSLIPTIKVEGVRILEANQTEPLLEIPKLEAVLELMPLVQKQVVVQKIALPKATLVWTGEAAQQKNKTQPQKNEKQATAAPDKSQKIWIDSISIDELTCKIGKEKPYHFQINKITLKELSKFSFDLVYQEKTIHVNGNFGSILDLAIQRAKLPINLTLAQDRANLRINGQIADLENLKKINLQINANIPNLSDFFKSWNIKNDKIPTSALTLKTSFEGDLDKAELGTTSLTLGKSDFVFTTKGSLNQLKGNPSAALTGTLSLKNSALNKLWGIKPFDLETKIDIKKESFSLTEMQLNAGKSDLKGNAQLTWKEKPLSLKGKLESTYFDIYDILETAKTEETVVPKTAEPQKKVLGTEKLPFDLLKQINADLQLNVAHLKFSDDISDYAGVNSSISIKNAELNMPAYIRLFGGTIQNQLKIQAKKQRVVLKTQGSNIQLDKIKRLSKDIQNSQLNLSLSLEASGENLHQLAASAQGNISAEITTGQIINKWFNSLPATLNVLKGRTSQLMFSTQDQKTELLCGAINLPVHNGIIVSQNQIALETNTLNFILNGRIDLKNETVNLAMIPSVSQTRGMANELLGIAQSITLSGPWTAVETKVNAGAVVENLVQTAAEKLTGQKKNVPSVQPKTLCQNVLGRALTSPKKVVATPPKKQEIKSTSPALKREADLKNQLIQSLSKALTAPKKK
ncbi:MAG: AsmA family protein [Alphaproteobacteria bacterium]